MTTISITCYPPPFPSVSTHSSTNSQRSCRPLTEFPYSHIRDALLQLEKVFRRQRTSLDKLTSKSRPPIAKNACSQSLAVLFNYTPYLGFVLRATNVRNAFEIYAPVLRLARRLLGPETKLLLSSEWDYSPFVYLPTAELPRFVLIGVPAYESSNPLLISLAGHELGHNVWSQEDMGRKLDAALRGEVHKALTTTFWSDYQQIYPNTPQSDLLTNMFAQQTWLPAHVFAKRQLEEIFCDAIGLRLFSEAYLHAFAYLLSPCVPGEALAHVPHDSFARDVLAGRREQFRPTLPPWTTWTCLMPRWNLQAPL